MSAAIRAVGIDLGTTYSCLAYLNEYGEPVSMANREGELSTPSVVWYDRESVVVGTEALRNSIVYPQAVVTAAKRHMGNADHAWSIGGRRVTPTDVSSEIIGYLLDSAKDSIGDIKRAVITVPAQFSDLQRAATVEAGLKAGLEEIDLINEPVAAALCYVLGNEGLAFSELSLDQNVMVADLGGGTFDLSVVRYTKDRVQVIACGGDLKLGGLDWNNLLIEAASKRFRMETGLEMKSDPTSRQMLALEAEQTKRSLSTREHSTLLVQHAGHRKTLKIDVHQFEKMSATLLTRMEECVTSLLKDNNLRWAKIDAVLSTGGASRMPMVKTLLKRLSGRTPNRALSPDHSIAQGAAYYAGMLLANDSNARALLGEATTERLQKVAFHSVSARPLGIIVRDAQGQRQPYYLIPVNSTLPAEAKQTFGTVSDGQATVRLKVVEGGTSSDDEVIRLGDCLISDLPRDLPQGTPVEVTLKYGADARVQVAARLPDQGREAEAVLERPGTVTPTSGDTAKVTSAKAGTEKRTPVPRSEVELGVSSSLKLPAQLMADG
jgi:molecular chaperone DnaK